MKNKTLLEEFTKKIILRKPTVTEIQTHIEVLHMCKNSEISKAELAKNLTLGMKSQKHPGHQQVQAAFHTNFSCRYDRTRAMTGQGHGAVSSS